MFCEHCGGKLVFCNRCGCKLNPQFTECPDCGCTVIKNITAPPTSSARAVRGAKAQDKGGCATIILGLVLSLLSVFVLPTFLFVLWRKSSPKKAKSIVVGMVLAIMVLLTVLGILAYIQFVSNTPLFAF